MKKENLKEKLAQEGALIFDTSDVPLSEKQWSQLETLSRDTDYEHIIGGDVGENHSVYVSRFVNDVDVPTDLKTQASSIKKIVMSETMLSFYASFTGVRPICLRRCQANLLQKFDFIGRHIDQHSNPDYIASVSFHLDSAYEGGDFVSQPESDREIRFHPGPHSVVVNRGNVWHEVEAVISGERRTLACFLSSQFGKSQRGRKDFEVSG